VTAGRSLFVLRRKGASFRALRKVLVMCLHRTALATLTILAAAASCGPSDGMHEPPLPNGPDSNGGQSIGGAEDAGAFNRQGTPVFNTRAAVTGTESQDGGAPPGDVDGGAGDAGPVVVPPVLLSLTANQTGRTGGDLSLTVRGNDVNQSSFGVRVNLFDSSGNPVIAFRDWAGKPSTASRIVLFDRVSAAGQSSFTRSVTLPGFMRTPSAIAAVETSIVDMVAESNAIRSQVTIQVFKSIGQSCDSNVVADRCGSGLSCSGSPATCQDAGPPVLTRFAYRNSANGPRMLFAGTDAADDLNSIRLEFLDLSDNEVKVDLTGADDYASSFDLSILTPSSALQSFFYANQATPGFEELVPKLAATPSGSLTGPGNRLEAALDEGTAPATGEPCDTMGFATCGEGDVCLGDPDPSVPATCAAVDAARDRWAQGALVLDPAGPLFAPGYSITASLWGDPPADCVATGVRGYPAGAVILHLANDVPSLTLTSDNPETNFHTALYVLRGTGASTEVAALGCNDLMPSTVTLTNVAAGDYTVVVASTTPAGGNFGVSIR
jgi:hypothetical protein